MQLWISDTAGQGQDVQLEIGEILCVAGKNGSGKSTLILHWARQNTKNLTLTGNREVSFNGSTVRLSPSESQMRETWGQSQLSIPEARTKREYHNNQEWLDSLLSRLDSFSNHCMREENDAHRSGNKAAASKAKDRDPIVQINEVFATIGLDLLLSVDRKANYQVTKRSLSKTYGIDQMSDGERAAIILLANAILAGEGQTFTVDEPERHMHRSISSPLLRELFRRRPDLIWIVATHDVSLMRDLSDAKLLVLYDYTGTGWKFDLLDSTRELPENVVDAIYGARERVLFVEGTGQNSLDTPLYQVLFPETTITSRASCNEVRRAVEALNGVGALNSMKARGLVDADNSTDAASLTDAGIAQLGVYAIESLYYHSSVIAALAKRQGKEDEVSQILQSACEKVSEADLKKWAHTCAERALRAHLRGKPPKLEALKESSGAFQIDLEGFLELEAGLLKKLTAAKKASDWSELIKFSKIKATQAPKFIAETLGLTARGYAEQARRVIATDKDVHAEISKLVPDPFAQ